MPQIESATLIKRFYEEVVVLKYPQITEKHCNELCRTPFKFFRKCILSSKFPTMRMKYFGIFVPKEKEITYELLKLREGVKNKTGKVTEDYLAMRESELADYLKYLNERPSTKTHGSSQCKEYHSLPARKL